MSGSGQVRFISTRPTRKHWQPETRNLKSPARRHRDPDSRSRPNRETGSPCLPIPAESGIGDSRESGPGIPPGRFPILAESGIGDSLPDSRPNRESGERELGISACGPRFQLATSHWQPLLTCVGGRKSAFSSSRIKGNIGPPDRVWYSLAHGMSLTWDEYPRFPDRPNRESGIPRNLPRFPDSRF